MKNNVSARFVGIILCLVMLVGILPLYVFADNGCSHENAVFYEGKAATCFEPGCIAYWYCEDCYSFLDENKQYLVDEDNYWLREQDILKDPATGHQFSQDTGKCVNCGLDTPVYNRVTSLDDVNEEDLYIFVAEVGEQRFVLGGLDDSNPDEESNIWCPDGVGNAIPVNAATDGSISLVGQNILGDGRPLEFMFDVNPDQWIWGQDEQGLHVVMPILPNYCVYPFQSQGYDYNGFMGVPRYAYGEYGQWDSSAWIIDFYTTEVTEDTYRDWEGYTHAEQLSWGVIGENVKEGDLLMYAQHYDSVGGAMFTLRLREFDDRFYFICGEDGFLEGVTQEVEYGPWDTNDVQYAISLYRCDVPTTEHTHNFVDGRCECGEEDPNYVPPHNHVFVDGRCECGESDPNYVPPHDHVFVDGRCECGESDPNYVPPHNHVFVDGRCECGEEDPNYVPPHNHVFVDGRCECGESDPNYVPPHNHVFVDGRCECGEEDPNYVPPHNHVFVDGRCECGEEDPNYVPPHNHVFVDGRCECGEEDPNYVQHDHSFGDWICEATVVGKHYRACECGEREYGDCQWDGGEITLKPTEDAEGEKTYTCTLCNGTKKESIDKLVYVDEIVSPDNENIKVEIPEGSDAALDENTILEVDRVEEELSSETHDSISASVGEDKQTDILATYDIELLLDGANVQPGGEIEVTLPIPENASAYDSLQVVYIDANGDAFPCETTVNGDGTLTFLTNHFSRYAVIGVKAEETEAPPLYVWIIALVVGILIILACLFGPLFSKKKAEASPEQEPESEPESEPATDLESSPESTNDDPAE